MVNPKRNIPLSILLTLAIASVLYCGLSGVLTLMIPYYLINPSTPLPSAFQYAQLNWATYVVSAGAVASLSTWYILYYFVINTMHILFIDHKKN